MQRNISIKKLIFTIILTVLVTGIGQMACLAVDEEIAETEEKAEFEVEVIEAEHGRLICDFGGSESFECRVGTELIFSAETEEGYRLRSYQVCANEDSEILIEGDVENGAFSFVMPGCSICVYGIYEREDGLKTLDLETIREFFGTEDLWFMNYDMLCQLKEAGYDLSAFEENDDIEYQAGMFSLPEAHPTVLLNGEGRLSWSEDPNAKIYLFGANSYFKNGAYYQTYTFGREAELFGHRVSAFCLNPYMNSPKQGVFNDFYELKENDMLLKALYYGYGGPGYTNAAIQKLFNDFYLAQPQYSAFQLSRDHCYYAITHSLVSKVYGDTSWAYGLSQKAADTVIALENTISTLPMPVNPLMKIQDTWGNTGSFDTYVENGVQRTTTLFVVGDERNTITIPLSPGVSITDGAGKTYTGSAVLNGGAAFFIHAPADGTVSGSYTSGELYPSERNSYKSVVHFSGNSSTQDIGFLTWVVDETSTGVSVSWKGTGNLKLFKSASDVKAVEGNSMYSLKGAEYEVFDGEHRIAGTMITDETGQAMMDGLTPGTYFVKEKKASPGYQLDQTEYTVTLALNQTTELHVKETPQFGTIELHKASLNPEMTAHNRNYSLKGAIYGIYDAAKKEVARIVTDENGDAKKENLSLGTYTLKEIEAPKGFMLDPNTYTVLVNGSGVYVQQCADAVKTVPITFMISKFNSETKKAAAAQLGGAEFTIKFYDVVMTTDPQASGEKPIKTWIFKTDALGIVKMDQAHKIGGDDLYEIQMEQTGMQTVLPKGTLTIQETKAPKGYQLNEEIFVKKIDVEKDDVTKINQNIDVYEDPLKVEIVINKIIHMDEINFSNGDPTFTFKVEGEDLFGKQHTYYQIVSFSEKEAETLKQGKDLCKSVSFVELPAGKYTVSELESGRYTLEKIININENGSLDGESVKFTLLDESHSKGTAAFVNKKYEHQYFSDTQNVVNHIPGR